MSGKKDDKYMKILYNTNKALHHSTVELLSREDSQSVIYRTSAFVVAPLLFTYIMWVVKEANKNNIKRLYFLARDGYIMKQIASIICEKNNINIECKYLYCSRIAWRIPQYHLEKEKCLDKIFINSVEVNLDKIFDRVSLSVQEKDEVFRLMHISSDERNRHLQWYEVLQYKEKFSTCNIFMDYVYQHSKSAYESTIGYLRQEGLYDEIKYAIVDTGWTGSMQTSLTCLLDQRKVEGYYFGLYNLPREADALRFHSFYFGKKTYIKNKVYFNNNLFECLCSSPDGMTIGYTLSDNHYKPVFSAQKNINIGNFDLDLHIKTIISYAEVVSRQIDITGFNYKKSLKLVFQLCRAFMVYPSVEEAECYGSYKFSDDVTEINIKELAAKMSLEEIKQNLLFWRIANRLKLKKYDKPYKQTCWIDASIMRCNNINREKYIRQILLFRWTQYLYMRISRKY